MSCHVKQYHVIAAPKPTVYLSDISIERFKQVQICKQEIRTFLLFKTECNVQHAIPLLIVSKSFNPGK